jgi:hypothetical protein
MLVRMAADLKLTVAQDWLSLSIGRRRRKQAAPAMLVEQIRNPEVRPVALIPGRLCDHR